ncbi:MAG: hypothetical protein OQK32_01235, partial [Gammaproteobacteria bacterium]|nr:hypothetical protein [Gammaproteobacteria bacterium]
EIKQKMDSLMISADSMGAVVKMMRRNELANFKIMLQVEMQRMMISGYGSKNGLCPDKDKLATVIRKANMKILKLGSLKQSGQWCNLYLTDDHNNSEHIKFNYNEVIIVDKAASSLTSIQPQGNTYRGPGNLMLQQTLRNKVILLSNAISSYYKQNKLLPKSISDIKCRDPFNRMAEVACASAQKGDTFYINHENNWVAIKSYLSNGKILKKCSATIPLDMLDRRYGECTSLDEHSIPG